jgi:hypothetical protein
VAFTEGNTAAGRGRSRTTVYRSTV